MSLYGDANLSLYLVFGQLPCWSETKYYMEIPIPRTDREPCTYLFRACNGGKGLLGSSRTPPYRDLMQNRADLVTSKAYICVKTFFMSSSTVQVAKRCVRVMCVCVYMD